MRKFIVLTILALSLSQLKSQNIKIGRPAEEVKLLIELSVKNSGNRNSSWDVKYYDGNISDVILCYQNQYLIDFRITTSYCKHYIMSNGKLSYIKTQYQNVSTEKLNEIYNNLYGESKRKGLFYDTDYEHYSKIYLAKNGLATIEYRKAE